MPTRAKEPAKQSHVSRALGAFGADFIAASAKTKTPFCLSISFKTPPFDQGRYEGVMFPELLSFGQAGLDHGVWVPSASVMLTIFGVLRAQHWTLYSVPFLRQPDRGRE